MASGILRNPLLIIKKYLFNEYIYLIRVTYWIFNLALIIGQNNNRKKNCQHKYYFSFPFHMYISQNSGFNHLCFDYPMYLSSTFHTDKGVFVYFSSTVWDNFPLLSANSHPWPFLKAKYWNNFCWAFRICCRCRRIRSVSRHYGNTLFRLTFSFLLRYNSHITLH